MASREDGGAASNESRKDLMRRITTLKGGPSAKSKKPALLARKSQRSARRHRRSHRQNVKAVRCKTENYGIKTVVCGAPNCRPGLRTVYVVPLGKKTIEGVESDGMLASGRRE